jgi:enoyl-CoA hydratase/carnithine racemase
MAIRTLLPGIVEVSVVNSDKLNAFGSAQIAQLAADVTEVCDDPANRVIIYRGAPSKFGISGFAGANLAELADLSDPEHPKPLPRQDARAHLEEGLTAISGIDSTRLRMNLSGQADDPGPVFIIGYFSGLLAGGMEFAEICDLRFMTPKAPFGLPEGNLAGLPGWGGVEAMRRMTSPVQLAEILLNLGHKMGGFVDAETALRWGLINGIVGTDEMQVEGIDQPVPAIEAHAIAKAQMVLKLDGCMLRAALKLIRMDPHKDCTPFVTDMMSKLMTREIWARNAAKYA